MGAAAGCAITGAVAAAAKKEQRSGPEPTIWHRMRGGMEEMPVDFPPRIMCDNIEATKASSEEILTQRRQEQATGDDFDLISST